MSENNCSSSEPDMDKYFFRASALDFKKIPGQLIGCWAGVGTYSAFENAPKLGEKVVFRKGMVTADNGSFIRMWQEVDLSKVGFGFADRGAAKASRKKWFPYTKGGEFRKWFGNNLFVVNWEDDGLILQTKQHHTDDRIAATNFNLDFIFKEGATYSSISSSSFSIRHTPAGFLYDQKGAPVFSEKSENLRYAISLLNSRASKTFLNILCPTLDFNSGSLAEVPALMQSECQESIDSTLRSLIEISRFDWDSSEMSWDFDTHPLLHTGHCQSTLKASYQSLRSHWCQMTLDMQRLEEKNNRIFIDAYGLQDELDEKVDPSEVTLTCNPHYRYGGDKSEEELEAMLLADTMRELVSYAVGCMFGRYSLDKPGLILANQGETLADYLAQVPQPSFPADDDNVIPLLDGDWFPDDITLRFRQFLRVAFGDAHYEDNLAFIEQALNVKGKRNYGLREYFLSDFYADHVKRYKKRPIYWLFSSPKGTFSALVYLHRYRPDTVSVVLSYLRDFRKKLASRLDYLQQVAINPSASQSEKTKASKEADTIKKQLIELDDYERDMLYPLATEQVELDLDDGVKVNYLKLGAALKKIPGLEAKED
ncbi:BREX-1 system adenine-specific DNA-methyltransferase PglX [Pseudomonas aeruginosa]